MNNYATISQKTWTDTRGKAHDRFVKEVLGDKPTRKSIAKRNALKVNINILEWAMVFLMIIIFIYVGFKTGIASLPNVDALVIKLSGSNTIPSYVIGSFKAVAVLLFTLLPSVSLIYMKIMHDAYKARKDTEKSTITLGKKKESWTRFFSLDWISPRLPLMTVWLGILWLGSISWIGNGTYFLGFIPGSDYFFLWIIPLVVEVAGANLVAKVLVRIRSHREGLDALYVPEMRAWENKREGYEKEQGYYRILFVELREALLAVRVGKAYPNRAMFNDPGQVETVNAIIESEFKRWNSGIEFANKALGIHEEIVMVEALAFDATEELPRKNGMYIPLDGAPEWTQRTLKAHMQRCGVTFSETGISRKGVAYNRTSLRKEYQAGYKAEPIWKMLVGV